LNRYLEAFWKFLCLVIVLHLVVLIATYFSGNSMGIFALRVFWPQLSSGINNIIISLVIAILVYLGVYLYWTVKE
jgi:predicted membrane protein